MTVEKEIEYMKREKAKHIKGGYKYSAMFCDWFISHLKGESELKNFNPQTKLFEVKQLKLDF